MWRSRFFNFPVKKLPGKNGVRMVEAVFQSGNLDRMSSDLKAYVGRVFHRAIAELDEEVCPIDPFFLVISPLDNKI